jgi:dCMP deaminase
VINYIIGDKMSWDKYYFDLCNTVASNSKCLSRKIGAIVVMDKSIISTGYNGPPRGIPSCGERYIKDPMYIEALKNDYNTVKEPREFFNGSIEVPHLLNYIKTTCPRRVLGYKSGEGLEYCVAGHAERNALINAARHGIAVKGAIMYMNCPISCKDCMIEIINAGISEIVCTKLEFYDEAGKYISKESNLKIRQFILEEV